MVTNVTREEDNSRLADAAIEKFGQINLVAPFAGRHQTGDAYWLITSAQRPKSAKIRAFEAWLREEFGRFAGEAPAAG